METPRDRIVANCATGKGSYLQLTTGKVIHDSWVAKAACGISTARTIVSSEVLKPRASRFGRVHLLRLTDTSSARYYAVDRQGALVGGEIWAIDGGAGCLQNEATAVLPRLPEDDIFTEASLGTSVVPDIYKAAPAHAAGDLWASGRRCA